MKSIDKSEQRTGNGSVFLFKAGTPAEHMDSAVWRAMKSGDRVAFDFIFQKYIKLLYTYGGKITRNHNVVEDCIQDLFVELWQKREAVSEVSSVKFYLLKSLRRRVVRKLSAQKELTGHNLPELEQYADAELPHEFKIIQEQVDYEQHEKLSHALSLLSKRQREAIYLKYYEKVTYEELAEIMNLEMRSAYNIVGKAIDVLRKNLRLVVSAAILCL